MYEDLMNYSDNLNCLQGITPINNTKLEQSLERYLLKGISTKLPAVPSLLQDLQRYFTDPLNVKCTMKALLNSKTTVIRLFV
jgi:hypothetical protein